MNLLIDAGNSRLKYACHSGQTWLAHGTTELDTPSLEIPEGYSPQHIVIANVAGPSVAASIAEQIARFDATVEWLVASPERCGVRNGYATPSRLGADRWAAAIGAWNLVGRDCLVICAGTATTLDLVQSNGLFAGGCIMPGLDMMFDALAHNTAGLPRSEGDWQMPPRNTHDAIATGCLLAQIGAIREMSQQLSHDAPILLAGGVAERLLPHLGPRASLHSDLVLQGLLCIATNGKQK